MWLDSKALLNQTAHKWILLVADARGTLVWGEAMLASHQSAHFLTQTSHKNSHVNKHRLINKHANEIFLPFHGLLYLCESRYRESWLARKAKITSFWNCDWSPNCDTCCFIFHITLAPECQETRMIKWWWGGFCSPAVYVCRCEEVFLPAWPMAGLSWPYHNASQYPCNNNKENNLFYYLFITTKLIPLLFIYLTMNASKANDKLKH